MKKKLISKNAKWEILIYTLILTIIGFIELYSTSKNSSFEEFGKQLVFFSISIVMMIIIIKIDYNTLAKISPFLYGGAILALIAVLFTSPINGARSWFVIGPFSFQPGEFAKICIILFLAYSISEICKRSEDINRPFNLLKIIGIAFLPIVFIALEPDFGTAIAYIVSLILMIYVAGINKKYIISAILLIIILIPIMYFFVLPEHAVNRINVYLNPNLDPRGIGYNIIQSKLAVGAGRLFGMGLGNRYTNTASDIFTQKPQTLFSLLLEKN